MPLAIETYIFMMNLLYNSEFHKEKMYNALPFGPGNCSNGVIASFSLHDAQNNLVFSDSKRMNGMSVEGESFMAGVFSSLEALTHFMAPSFNSIKRL